jgi:4'-phosphopantetheinyl transferase
MVWLAQGEHEVPATGDWLTPHEAGRASAMRFTKRRTEYTLRRWVCKRAVAEVLGIPDQAGDLARIEVGHLASGAPTVRLDGADSRLAVSISDRAGWAVCVVALGPARVGCDLERVETRSAGFLADFLSTAEQAYVAATPLDDRALTANLLWSAKESALKLAGTGLAQDTQRLEVRPSPTGSEAARAEEAEGADPGWSRLEVHAADAPMLHGWWRREGDFVLTVASDPPLPCPTRLPGSSDLRTAVPSDSWLDRPLAD